MWLCRSHWGLHRHDRCRWLERPNGDSPVRKCPQRRCRLRQRIAVPGRRGSHDISLVRRFGNFWLNKLVNLLYGTRYTDLCYGYNAFRRECLDAMALDPGHTDDFADGPMQWGDGFEVETLITVRVAKAGLRVTEVPSLELVRHFGASNLNAFSDGLRVLRTIHAERNHGVRQASTERAVAHREAEDLLAVIHAEQRGELVTGPQSQRIGSSTATTDSVGQGYRN